LRLSAVRTRKAVEDRQKPYVLITFDLPLDCGEARDKDHTKMRRDLSIPPPAVLAHCRVVGNVVSAGLTLTITAKAIPPPSRLRR